MDFDQEIEEISKLVRSAHLLECVKKEVHAAVQNKTMVLDGEHARRYTQDPSFDAVVIAMNNIDRNEISRRITSKIPNLVIEHVVDNVLGLKRGK